MPPLKYSYILHAGFSFHLSRQCMSDHTSPLGPCSELSSQEGIWLHLFLIIQHKKFPLFPPKPKTKFINCLKNISPRFHYIFSSRVLWIEYSSLSRVVWVGLRKSLITQKRWVCYSYFIYSNEVWHWAYHQRWNPTNIYFTLKVSTNYWLLHSRWTQHVHVSS